MEWWGAWFMIEKREKEEINFHEYDDDTESDNAQ